VSLPIGELVNGKYRVVRLLGDGGMGSVYEARHEALGARVALKSLHPELARGAIADRFLQEARAAARIQNPHVVRVTDVDKSENGLPFMVLEYVEGRTLQSLYEDLYNQGRRLSYAEALDFAMQLFEGVEAAHEGGVVHRDLKPDNVMITAGPRGTPLLKLLDFGVAKLDEPAGSRPSLTRPGVILGTPQYMAPEQVYTAGAVDARADVFALGVILFEMLAGRRPVGGDDPQQIAVAYMTGRISRLSDLAPELAPQLVQAVHRAMEPAVANRFATVRELREAIEPFAAAVQPSAPGLGRGLDEPRSLAAQPGLQVLLRGEPISGSTPPRNVAGAGGTQILPSRARGSGGGAADGGTQILPGTPLDPPAGPERQDRALASQRVEAAVPARLPGTWGYDPMGRPVVDAADVNVSALGHARTELAGPGPPDPHAREPWGPQPESPGVSAPGALRQNSPWILATSQRPSPDVDASPMLGRPTIPRQFPPAPVTRWKAFRVYLWAAAAVVLLFGLGVTIGAAVYFDWFDVFADDEPSQPNPPHPTSKKPSTTKPRPPGTGRPPGGR
jgi:serine/threonine-protein kinase